MLGVNKVILIGRLGKDPELRYTPGGQPVANFTLATSERWNDKNGQRQEKTEWHNIIVWAKMAELVNKYLKKGSAAYVEGRITTRSWDDRDGNKKYKTEIVASQVQFLSATGEPSGGAPAEGYDTMQDSGSRGSPGPADASPQDQGSVVEEDLPF